MTKIGDGTSETVVNASGVDERASLLTAERMRILKMIEDGSVTAEEGARLLEALGEDRAIRVGETAAPSKQMQSPRRLHVRVTDTETGQRKFDINLPWSLVSVGINMGARFAPDDINVDEIVTSVQPGRPGKVMDIVDEDDKEHVEIFIE